MSSDTATFKGSSTQTRIRKHASRSACRTRRAGFVLERHNPRQLPPITGACSCEAPAAELVVQQDLQASASVGAENLSPRDTTDTKDAKHFDAVTARPDPASSVSTVSTEFPVGFGTDDNEHPFCPLDGLSPFLAHACPIVLEPGSRRLFHLLLDNSPSNRFGEYRDAWLPVVQSDPAAFQQYLSTFALHLQRSYHTLSAELKVLTLRLHSQSLQAVNVRMRSSAVASDQGLLAAVVSFVAHYQVQQRYDMWHVHMQGLKDIIALQGGARLAFHNKPRLRLLLFFINVQGYWVRDLPILFPPPYELLPRIPDLPVSLSMISSFHNATQAARIWRYTFTEGPAIPGILDDLVMITAHLSSESVRTKGACWKDIMTTGLFVNPLIYRLQELRIKQPHNHSRRVILQETIRIAALLFLRRTRWHAMFASTLVESQAATLKTWLENASDGDWTGFETLKCWVSVMGACSANKHSAERLWFVKEMLRMVQLMRLSGSTEMHALVKSVLWIEDLFVEVAQVIWKELRMIS